MRNDGFMNPIRSLRQSRVEGLLFEFRRWAATESGIHAVALIGSYARDTATEESDVDLIVVVSLPNIYIRHRQWTSLFGDIDRHQIEDYGACTSLRVWYADGLEVEFGFVAETWAAAPHDEEARKIASDGMKILFERKPILSLLV